MSVMVHEFLSALPQLYLVHFGTVAMSLRHGLRASGITLPSLSTLRDFANLSLVDGLAFFQARSLGPEWSKLESREGYVKAIEDLKISKEHRIEWNMYTMYHFNSFQV